MDDDASNCTEHFTVSSNGAQMSRRNIELRLLAAGLHRMIWFPSSLTYTVFDTTNIRAVEDANVCPVPHPPASPSCLLSTMQAFALSFSYLLLLSPAFAHTSSVADRASVHATSQAGSLISPEISAYAQSFIDSNLTPGMTLAVVRLDNTSYTYDFGSWGNRTEDGDLARPDVSRLLLLVLGVSRGVFILTHH